MLFERKNTVDIYNLQIFEVVAFVMKVYVYGKRKQFSINQKLFA